MDCTEAIVNNRSVKTVRKLQVLLSLHDEKQQSNSKINKDFSTCRTLQKNDYIYHGGRVYTVHAKQRKKTSNKLSVFLKTNFIL